MSTDDLTRRARGVALILRHGDLSKIGSSTISNLVSELADTIDVLLGDDNADVQTANVVAQIRAENKRLADEVDRLRAEADRWKARSVTAGTDLDAARAALERVKDIVQNPPIVRTVPGGNPPGYAGPIHLYDIRDLSLDVLRALEGKPS